MARLPPIALDLSPLRESRDLRLLITGEFLIGLGTQAALVALPYQLYTKTGSPLLTGLLGTVELGPLMAAALLGGAIADRPDGSPAPANSGCGPASSVRRRHSPRARWLGAEQGTRVLEAARRLGDAPSSM